MTKNQSDRYQEALRRIEENKKTKSPELILRDLGLIDLPPNVRELKHLEVLNLSSFGENKNIIKNLPNWFGELKNLQSLLLNNTQISELPDWFAELKNLQSLYLSNTQISKLPDSFVKLKNLRELSLINTKLRRLPDWFGELKNLQLLYLDNMQISKLPDWFAELKNLHTLYLDDMPISELPDWFSELKNLQLLYLDNTQISKLPDWFGELKNLQLLSLDNMQISELPDSFIRLQNLESLYLDGTPINIPPEIKNNSDNPQLILNYYFENLAGKDRPLNEIKMLILGEGLVGKTALINRLMFDKYKKPEKTDGIDIHKWNVEVGKGKRIRINIWDFGGQEIMHATHQFFLTRRSIYLLVLASRGDEKSNRLEDWLKLIQNFGGESPVFIVCNKSDEHKMNLDERALREKYPNIREIVKVSAYKGDNTKTLKRKIFAEIKKIPHVFDPFSKKWFAVKERLEAMKENYIPFEKYEEICEKEDVTKDLDRETLVKFLHDLGIVLNFRDDKTVNDTNVLKPQWITDGVYKILNSKQLERKNGVLTLEMVDKILDNRRYPKHKHRFIVQMMEKFERCFPLETKETFLVPDLLPKEQPDFHGWKPEKSGMGFQYHYEIEPSSFITRFIVNMNQYVDDKQYWRKGVVLINADGNRALVKADLADKIIFIWIDGKMETRRGFLSIIRRQFEKIHGTIENLKYKEYVWHENGLIDFKDLIDLEENKIEEHYFPHLKAKIKVSELLNGIETFQDRTLRSISNDLSLKSKIDIDDLLKFTKLNPSFVKQRDLSKLLEMSRKKYDVAFSYASEDRDFVSKVYRKLKDEGVDVYYDLDEEIESDNWGKELVEELDDVYRKRSKCVVMFISENYADKIWTKLERRSALANAINEKREYVLPARFDDTELPGLLPTIVYADLKKETPESFAQKIIRKLRKLS